MNYKDYYKDNKCPYCGRVLVFNEDKSDCWCEVSECGFNHQFDGFRIVATIKSEDDDYNSI